LSQYTSLVGELLTSQKNGEGELRLGRHSIAVSDIADQYYCEKKVELRYLHGQVETEERTLGLEAHEKLLEDTTKIKRRRLWQEVYKKKIVIAQEVPLLVRSNGILFAGRLDSELFYDGKPLVVFEYKFSKSGSTFKSQHIQAMTYCALLNYMDFDTGRLFYALVIADPESRSDMQLKDKAISAVAKNGPKEITLNLENARIHLCKSKLEDAQLDLDWATQFWKKAREALPTKNPNKCRKCEYNRKCVDFRGE
jgi:CRISPR/Cas system-associated exonuclease Cas4 (RecB family)